MYSPNEADSIVPPLTLRSAEFIKTARELTRNNDPFEGRPTLSIMGAGERNRMPQQSDSEGGPATPRCIEEEVAGRLSHIALTSPDPFTPVDDPPLSQAISGIDRKQAARVTRKAMKFVAIDCSMRLILQEFYLNPPWEDEIHEAAQTKVILELYAISHRTIPSAGNRNPLELAHAAFMILRPRLVTFQCQGEDAGRRYLTWPVLEAMKKEDAPNRRLVGGFVETLEDRGGDANPLDIFLSREALENFKELTPRQRFIMIARFVEGGTLDEVARELGISRATVTREQRKAIKIMRRGVGLTERARNHG